MIVDGIIDHAGWVLFVWVFANQGGVPVPAVPALVGAGALAANGHLNLAAAIALAVGASLAADLTWYGLGRWRGAQVLGTLDRVSPSAGTLTRSARHVFVSHAEAFQMAARFLPEVNAIAGGFAGATKLSVIRFVGFGVVSALTWAGGWIGLGYLLGDVFTGAAARLSIRLIVVFLAPFALYLFFQRARRHRVIRAVRQARLSPGELAKMREAGDRVAMLDQRLADAGAAREGEERVR
jgi:membrane protein DedA with SNARE-associated domain